MTKKTISNLCAYDSKETALCTDERCELWMRPDGVTDKRKGANCEWGQTHETWSTQGCLSWSIIILTSPNRQPIYKGAREEEGQEHRHLLRLALNVVWLSRLNEKLPSVQYKGWEVDRAVISCTKAMLTHWLPNYPVREAQRIAPTRPEVP